MAIRTTIERPDIDGVHQARLGHAGERNASAEAVAAVSTTKKEKRTDRMAGLGLADARSNGRVEGSVD